MEDSFSQRYSGTYSAYVWLYVLDSVLGMAVFLTPVAGSGAALNLYSPNHGIQDSTSNPTP